MLFDRDALGGDFEAVHVVRDEGSGLRALVAVHSTRRGPAFGGIRRWRYPDEDTALDDALRLAAMMSYKCALAGLDAGGAKTVVLDHPGLRAGPAYGALGRFVESMQGRYVCGPDVGTGDAELQAVRAETTHVNPEGNDAGASTAAGVLAGIRGLLGALYGDPTASERRFVVQGLGAVGFAVATDLVEQGATVLAADVSPEACRRAADRGIQIIAPDEVMRTPADVLVPCALGGILTEDVSLHLPVRGVCGSANNQLASDQAAALLHRRDVLYVPDFVANAGAVIEGVLTVQGGATNDVRAAARAHIAEAEATTRAILAASSDDRDPHQVALEMAKDRLR